MVSAGEPVFLFNMPVKHFVRLLGALILFFQCFSMFYTLTPAYAAYVVVMMFALTMNAVLTWGVKKKKKVFILAYMMYMVMGLVFLFGVFFGEIDFWYWYKKLPICDAELIEKKEECQDGEKYHSKTHLICLLIFSSISFCLDSVQLFLCWKLYKYLQKAVSARDFHVSYYANEVVVPGAPPRYSPNNSEVPANNSDPGPLPPKPPMYEALDVIQLEENRQRTASQPPTYQQEPAPATPENLMEI